MPTDHTSQHLRQREDEVEVGSGKQFGVALPQPGLHVVAVAFGAVTIAAGVIGVLLVATVVTRVEVTPELSSATGDQGLDDTSMP